jgi:hypothetical protein
MANVDYILKLSKQFCKIADHFDLEEFSSLQTGKVKFGFCCLEEF